jgi:hypothetical protein
MTGLRKHQLRVAGALALIVALLGCNSGGSEPATGDKAADAETSGASGGTTSGGTPVKAEPGREAFVYAAVIEGLVDESRVDRRDKTPIKVLFVLDGVVPDAAKPTALNDPAEPFSHDVKDGIRFLAELGDLPPVEFVAARDDAVVGTNSGKRPGEARHGGAIITLGPIEGQGNRVEVGNSVWVNGLSGRWQTYVVVQHDNVWKVTGTTGPLAIS